MVQPGAIFFFQYQDGHQIIELEFSWIFFFWQKQSKSGAVERMTDTSKYTGSHKEWFDDSGKGKGLEVRKDFDCNAAEGYVGGYKGKDTYDKTH